MKRLLALAFAALLACAASAGEANYAKRPEVQAFARQLAERHGFGERQLLALFARAKRTEPVLQAIQLPAERTRPWQEYRAAFLDEKRVAAGVAFWNTHRETLERAERIYGVAPEYVLAIIGVETYYGRHTGRYRVFDALTTLAFDYPPRAQYFRAELENYLLLARERGVDALSIRGSYAGAIGMPQFMPGSTRRYAVDFDGDGTIDLRANAADVIGSVANFLRQHGWAPGGPVLLQARVAGEDYKAYADGVLEPKHPLADLVRAGVEVANLPPELAGEPGALIELATPGGPSDWRVGLKNFHVITRYNRSAFYAAAVADLAQALREAQKPVVEPDPAQEPGK